MAADWIKMRSNIKDDPDVVLMAGRLSTDEFSIVGRLHAVWAWLDQHSEDGTNVRITSAYLDRLTACPGFADALRAVGWLDGRDGLLLFPNFLRHNGESAKARAVEAKRKAEQRAREALDGTNVPPLVPRKLGPEKRRVEKRNTEPPNPQPKAAGGEQASHEAELPKPELWNRVCAVVGRDPAKAKSHLEMCALSEASGITEDDMQTVERFAAAERKKPQQERKGKWLAHTLLGEFHAEVGKARMALGLTSPHPSRPDPRAGIDPAAFLSWLRQNFPFGRQDITLETADADLIAEYDRDQNPNQPPP